MLCKNWKIDATDFTAYAHKAGLSVFYNPVFNSQNVFTLDGTEHSDELAQKATYVITLNPLTEAQTNALLAAYAAGTFLTIYDPLTNTNRVIAYKRTQMQANIPIVKGGVVVRWTVGQLTFVEK